MANISANELACELLEACLRDGTWPARVLDDLIERALDEADPFEARNATRALFGVVIERLGDLFEPALCDVYARLFSHIIAKALPQFDAAELLLRYNRVRQVKRFAGGEVRKVFVLSRVTLGADIAVTSLMLAAAKERFPDAEICFVGPEKNAELFANDSRIVPVAMPYGRSSLLRERLQVASELLSAVDEPSSIVIDPDSRLTQLGLLPVGDDDARYYFFESRAFGGETDLSLPKLAAAWCSEVFDMPEAKAYLAPAPQPRMAEITVSWGVGENAQKRLDDEFEYQVTGELLRLGERVLLDRGAGGEEAVRVNRIVERLGAPEHLLLHDGSYSSFASHILQSRLYVGYDSVGQHVAAASGVALISLFRGFASDRMLARWRPEGENAHVIVIAEDSLETALGRTLNAISAAEGAVRESPTDSTRC